MKYYNIEELQINEEIEELQNTGVYIMKCINTQECYIGSTTRNFRARWKEIRKQCRNGSKKVSKLLRSCWKEYEDKGFVFGVLEICDKELIHEKEQYWINYLKPKLNTNYKVDKYVVSNNVDYQKNYLKKVKEEQIRKAELIKYKVNSSNLCTNIEEVKYDVKMWVIEIDSKKFFIKNLIEFCKISELDYNWFKRTDWLKQFNIIVYRLDKQ